MARSHRLDAQVALRARMIRMLDYDSCVSAVALRLELDEKTVRLWRDRFVKGGLPALYDGKRTGRPRHITDVDRCALISMACGRPKDFGVPYQHVWTYDALHTAFQAHNPDVHISRTSVIRVLKGSDLKPHRMKAWLHSQDPEFKAKVNDICALYTSPPSGAVVLSVDEKSGMQALSRKNPTKYAGCGRSGRREVEYKRHGTRNLFAAFNTQTGHVFAQVTVHRKAVDLIHFMDQVAAHYPTGDVHIVWDNLNIHHGGVDDRWVEFNRRHGDRFHFHYTPLHASWVNQVELFFSRVQRRVLRHGSFESVAELKHEVLGYIDHWNAHERKPFRWAFRGYPLETVKAAA